MKTVATGPLQQEHTCELCTFNLSPQLQATGHKPDYFPGFTNEEAEAWRGQIPFVQITPMGVSFMSLHISEEREQQQTPTA